MSGLEKPALPSSFSSSILSAIQKCKEGTFITKIDEWGFKNYELGLITGSRKAYIGAEIHFDNLDKGSELTYSVCCSTKRRGIDPGDKPAHYIDMKLGGGGESCNAFPLNNRIDTSDWKFAQQQIYNFVKKGQGKSFARLMFGNEFNRRGEGSRPEKIYFYFELFENGTKVGQAIEGVLDNLDPRLTHQELFKKLDDDSHLYEHIEKAAKEFGKGPSHEEMVEENIKMANHFMGRNRQ